MVKLNRIYTRTGDKGMTGMVAGPRLPKQDTRVEAIGAVDETNAALGVAALHLGPPEYALVERIQNDLFDLGADLATPKTGVRDKALRIIPAQVTRLEKEIDAMNAALNPLTSFVLPGGTVASAHLHLARTCARRAERAMFALAAAEWVNPAALHYINRVSDHLFVLARWCNGRGNRDVLWKPGENR